MTMEPSTPLVDPDDDDEEEELVGGEEERMDDVASVSSPSSQTVLMATSPAAAALSMTSTPPPVVREGTTTNTFLNSPAATTATATTAGRILQSRTVMPVSESMTMQQPATAATASRVERGTESSLRDDEVGVSLVTDDVSPARGRTLAPREPSSSSSLPTPTRCINPASGTFCIV